jgi:hypothetical protein
VVIYRVRKQDDAVLLQELSDLARARRAELHLLAGPFNAVDEHGGPRRALQPGQLRGLS